jgi:hypothetical protein
MTWSLGIALTSTFCPFVESANLEEEDKGRAQKEKLENLTTKESHKCWLKLPDDVSSQVHHWATSPH